MNYTKSQSLDKTSEKKLSETLDRFETQCRRNRLSKTTVTTYRCRANQFLRFYESHHPSQVTETEVVDYFRKISKAQKREKISRAAFLQSRGAVAKLYQFLTNDESWVNRIKHREFTPKKLLKAVG